MKDPVCLIWDVLHFVGVVFVIIFPYQTCLAGIVTAVLWKRKYKIAHNIFCCILWWSMTNIHGWVLGLFSSFILLMTSPRVFHEIFNNTLTVQCTWILNAIYPFFHRTTSNDGVNSKITKVYASNPPNVSIILCNKDETKEVFEQSVMSIIQSKTYAENILNINHIRLILADGGSKNIDIIQQSYGSKFDSIEVIAGGKLTGRHHCSLKETSDIIIAYDSDRKYDKRNTFELLFPFFNDCRSLETNGYQKEQMIVGSTHYVNSDGIFPFNGGNSAYLRKAYMKHPFNININQTTTSSIWKEEEIDWGNNLMKCGKVVSVQALYSDINPLPFPALLKRMLNCKDSFAGGVNRCSTMETDSVIIYKISFMLLFSLFFPLLL